jgi:hypothetical protein
VLLRRENHVFLDIDLGSLPTSPTETWKVIQIPATTSVKWIDTPLDVQTLKLDIVVRGATSRIEYKDVCNKCEKREGKRKGTPGLIDFHSNGNILKPKNGSVRLHFTFCCYSHHRQGGDQRYVYVSQTVHILLRLMSLDSLEVILRDITPSAQPRIVVRKELPYCFEVVSKLPTQIKKRAHDQVEQETTLRNVRRRTDSSSPVTDRLGGTPRSTVEQPQVIPQPVAGTPSGCPEQAAILIRRASASLPSPPANTVRAPLTTSVFNPFIGTPFLFDVHPLRSSVLGGQRVWLAGSHFPTSAPLFVRFGASIAKAVRLF